MKYLITILLALSINISNFAKTNKDINEHRLGNIFFEQSEHIETGYKWQSLSGHIYPVYISKNKTCYIIKTSKSGKQYRQYLPKEIQETILKELKNKELKN